MMDDDKVDLDLVAALIKHIVLEEEVQWDWAGGSGSARAGMASHTERREIFVCSFK